MRYILLLLLCTHLIGSEKDWILDKVSVYAENDVILGTDSSYSAGERLSLLYYIPQEDYLLFDILGNNDINTYSYVTFAATNQIFTPENVATTAFIPNDRPYAGWTYLEGAIHKASANELRSLSLKVGMVGPASLSEEIQRNFHTIFNLEEINGWEHQLGNELGINLKYTQKWRYTIDTKSDMENSITPFVSTELGNIAINATAGVTARFGWNIHKDYGNSSIDIGADPGIPVYGAYTNLKSRPWGFSFNFTGAGTFVARDLFLDGNSFKDSHSVNKKPFVAYIGYGFTLRYQDLQFDFMTIHNSKQFDQEKDNHVINSVIFSWLF